ncbi:MAG TPA: amidohydrolase family protein [Terriglobia bacterium]|nr:amidohydrolase family protein [Terriglobia bacterium]
MKSSWKFVILVAAAGMVLTGPARLVAQAPNLILHNGKILTVDKNFAIVQAIAVTGNQISATGTDQAVLALAGPGTQKIDLKGRTVIPGIIDTHRHMYGAAEGAYGGTLSDDDLRRYPVSWAGVRTKEDVLNQIRGVMTKYKAQFTPGRWIYMNNRVSFMGEGDENSANFAKILYDELNQWELDKVTPDNPVLMSLGIPDFNGFLANKKAMDWLMANHGDFVRQNGRYWIDSQGRPDGHLEPPASRLVLPFTYDRKPEVLAPLYEKNMQEHLAMGMTAISTRLPKDSLAAYQLLERQGKLNWRIGYGDIETFGNTDLSRSDLKAMAAKIGQGTDRIWMTGMGPTAIDGVTSRACTDLKRTGDLTPIDSWYPMGQCHTDIEYRGSPKRAAPISKNYYGDWVLASGRDRLRFANVHVAGDRATGNMLNYIEQLQKQYGPDATKDWGLDHCDMVNPKDFERIARTKVFMSCYVLHSVNGSRLIAQAYGEQVAHTYPSPLKSMLKAGARVVLESDSASYIWDDFEAAVTRKDRTGKVWAPQERVTPEEALKMFTIWAAEYVLKADKIGSLEKGKLADIVVLDKDYLTIPGDDIGSIQPQLVVFDGKIVHVHTDFANEYNLRPAGAVIASYADLVKRRTPRAGVSTGG